MADQLPGCRGVAAVSVRRELSVTGRVSLDSHRRVGAGFVPAGNSVERLGKVSGKSPLCGASATAGLPGASTAADVRITDEGRDIRVWSADRC